MTLQVMPDRELLECGWRCKQRFIYSEPDFVYRKEGSYGWFDKRAAWEYERAFRNGRRELQYPTQLMPPADVLESRP